MKYLITMFGKETLIKVLFMVLEELAKRTGSDLDDKILEELKKSFGIA